jgi:hypothetical protein
MFLMQSNKPDILILIIHKIYRFIVFSYKIFGIMNCNKLQQRPLSYALKIWFLMTLKVFCDQVDFSYVTMAQVHLLNLICIFQVLSQYLDFSKVIVKAFLQNALILSNLNLLKVNFPLPTYVRKLLMDLFF